MNHLTEKREPNYKQIYFDIINLKYPEKQEACQELLAKTSLSELDIIELNQKIFGSGPKSSQAFNQKHRSYSKSTIFEILNYQKKNRLNNVQLSLHYRLSRNTIAKWKKLFYEA